MRSDLKFLITTDVLLIGRYYSYDYDITSSIEVRPRLNCRLIIKVLRF